jgi:hypothetical protein
MSFYITLSEEITARRNYGSPAAALGQQKKRRIYVS